MELAILMWFAVGAGIAAGAFVLARTAIQLAVITYEVVEKRMDRGGATRQGAALVGVLVVALAVTSLIGAVAVLGLFAGVLNANPLPVPTEPPE